MVIAARGEKSRVVVALCDVQAEYIAVERNVAGTRRLSSFASYQSIRPAYGRVEFLW